jgi:hypothetical protein
MPLISITENRKQYNVQINHEIDIFSLKTMCNGEVTFESRIGTTAFVSIPKQLN